MGAEVRDGAASAEPVDPDAVKSDDVGSVSDTQEIPVVATSDERSDESNDVGATVIDLRSGDPVIRLEPAGAVRSRARSPYVRFVKPVVDFVLGTVALVVSAPIVLIVAIALRATMGKRVLFRQPRVGRDGKVFDVLKFRTMAADRRAEPVVYVGPERRENHKSADDPRHTRFGRFLRRWSLDELPQFMNVIKGEMSMVGPRPELVSVVEKYEGWQHDRHQVRPGITGIWQVSERNDIPLHEATHLDIEYIEAVSFVTDLKILFKTVPAMLGRSQGK